MPSTRYDGWPFAWREVAAEAVTRHGTHGQRHTTTANLAAISPATVRRCACDDLQRARLHPGKYTRAQVVRLVAMVAILPAPVGLEPKEMQP